MPAVWHALHAGGGAFHGDSLAAGGHYRCLHVTGGMGIPARMAGATACFGFHGDRLAVRRVRFAGGGFACAGRWRVRWGETATAVFSLHGDHPLSLRANDADAGYCAAVTHYPVGRLGHAAAFVARPPHLNGSWRRALAFLRARSWRAAGGRAAGARIGRALCAYPRFP